MLLLLFQIAESGFAVDARRVVEVVPRVALRPVPRAPQWLAGLLSYRGQVVPVVELGILGGAFACRTALSTRLIIVELNKPSGHGKDRLGLVAERVDNVATVGDGQFVAPPMPLAEAPYLGAMVRVGQGLVQLIEPDRILPEAIYASLFGGETRLEAS